VSETAEPVNPKPQGLPNWVVALVLVICLVVVYFVYTKMTAPHVTEFKTIKHG
jgi:type VI protein secretion system component VasF